MSNLMDMANDDAERFKNQTQELLELALRDLERFDAPPDMIEKAKKDLENWKQRLNGK